jgi:bifunctional DNA-binding transcriptional regulator/antitoxin component of YhaV-PrlF toxin-antitoxin module
MFLCSNIVRDNREEFERKISSNGEIYVPQPFRVSKQYFMPEPGIFTPSGEIRLYSERSPPVVSEDTVFDGELLQITMAAQGQVTLPVRFRKIAGIQKGDTVLISRDNDDGISELHTIQKINLVEFRVFWPSAQVRWTNGGSHKTSVSFSYLVHH